MKDYGYDDITWEDTTALQAEERENDNRSRPRDREVV
jgi:hypothetical protein